MTSQTLEQLLAEPQWQRAVRYSYSPATNVYTFFLPGHGMQMVPIAIFSPIVRQDIPFDPEEVCETIAEAIAATPPDESFDIDS